MTLSQLHRSRNRRSLNSKARVTQMWSPGLLRCGAQGSALLCPPPLSCCFWMSASTPLRSPDSFWSLSTPELEGPFLRHTSVHVLLQCIFALGPFNLLSWWDFMLANLENLRLTCNNLELCVRASLNGWMESDRSPSLEWWTCSSPTLLSSPGCITDAR